MKKLNEMLTTLNTTKVNGENYDEILAKITAEIQSKNDAKKGEIYAKLFAMDNDKKALFVEFINNQSYEIDKLKENKKTGLYELIKGTRQLSFCDLDKAYAKTFEDESNPAKNIEIHTLANSLRYVGLTGLFLNNLMTDFATEISTKNAKVKVPTLGKKADDGKEIEVDFAANSNNALVAQLNAIVATILPQDLEVTMIKADIRALKQAFTKEKSMKFTTIKEVAMINKIFNCIEIRMNGKAYEVDSQAIAHKVSK